MPIPNPRKNEKDFTGRCMSDPIMKEEYPDAKQRVAICISKTRSDLVGQAGLYLTYQNSEYDEETNTWKQK